MFRITIMPRYSFSEFWRFLFTGSGTIELTEFVRIIEARKETVNIEEAMIEAFRVFDQDQNGYIERRELKNVMKSLGNNLSDKDIDRMMKDADKNGDGRIDFQGNFQIFEFSW